MPEPPDGWVRVYARANVLGLTVESWGDLPADYPHLEACLARGLVQRTGPHGEAPPDEVPPRRCCGG